MKSFRIAALCAAAAAIVLSAQPGVRAADSEAAEAKAHGPIPWTVSLAAAQKTAAREGKPILVDFWAEWCSPCKEMLATTYKDKTVVARSAKFVPLLVNVDRQPGIAKKFNVEGFPTVLFLDARGKVLARSLGFLPAKELLKMMTDVSKKAKS